MASKDDPDYADLIARIPPGWWVGIDCGPGWKQLVLDTHKRIVALVPNYEIHQVKQKFGTLRYYVELPDDTHHDMRAMVSIIINEAERDSAYICEECGKPGEVRSHSTVRTLCETCQIFFWQSELPKNWFPRHTQRWNP